MVETLATRLEHGRRPFVGRQALLDQLVEFARGTSRVATFIHGIPGIGKSELLAEVVTRARADGVCILDLDCGAIEPTDIGVLDAIARSSGTPVGTIDQLPQALSQLPSPALMVLDGYEAWGLIDPWIRDELVPRLPEGVRVLIASRYEPTSPWRYDPRWQSALTVIELDPLNDAEALELLGTSGVEAEAAHRLNVIARGHPLALTLASSALRDQPATSIEDAATVGVATGLTGFYLDSVRDRRSRAALEAASVTRRVTLPLLAEQLGADAAEDAYRRLEALPFVRNTHDGLAFNEVAKEAISARLRAANPARHRELRRAAWRHLQAESRGVGIAELWRYTADILYLLQNPILREGFFPSTAQSIVIEPATPHDLPAVRRISLDIDGPESTAVLDAWIELRPDLFMVTRDQHGDVVGFRWSIASNEVSDELARRDPVLALWLQDLAASDAADTPAFFLRRWMSLDGEAPGEVQGLCWIDCKRSYMAMRPHIGHVYVAQHDFTLYESALTELGFRDIPEITVDLDGKPLNSKATHFGPGSVDGWMSRLLARELGIDPSSMLDETARQLILDGQHIPLTPLELDVMRYLIQRRGQAVSHADLIETIWGYSYTGDSNVDAVAIRALRAKLGPHASLIETVRGTGYRLREQ